MTYISYFREITKGDVDLVGVKGVNLSSLIPHVKVPSGFVVTTKLYDEFLEKTGAKKKVEAMLTKLDEKETQEIANQIQKLIVDVDMPEELTKEILEAYDALGFSETSSADSLIKGAGESNVAVRSSYVQELKHDEMNQLTFLNIEGKDRLIKSIKVCFAAQFTSGNLNARKELKQWGSLRTAVIVQKMINSEKSALAYSYNPNTKVKDELYIEAIFGLGEGFTVKDTAFDVYVLDKKKLEIKNYIIAEQSKKYVLDPDTKKTTRVLLKESGKKQKLNDKEVREVGRICKKLTEALGKDQRVEVVIRKEMYYVLQSKEVKGIIEVIPDDDVSIVSAGVFEETLTDVSLVEKEPEREEESGFEESYAKETKVVVEKSKPLFEDDLDFVDSFADEVGSTMPPLKKKEEDSFEEKYEEEDESSFDTFENENNSSSSFEKEDEEAQSSETASADKAEKKDDEDDSIFSNL